MRSDEGYVPTPDGVRLFYRKIGSGPDVVIPNGLCFIGDFTCLAEYLTLISYDLRNRGLSDQSRDGSQLCGDIHSDVEDLEAVRRHFGIAGMNLIGHSYIGLLVALYAMKFPDHATRIVQIGPMEPEPGRQYPPHLTCADGVMQQVFSELAPLRAEAASADPVDLCRKAWSILGRLYVINPGDSSRIAWGRCELSNERNFLQYWQTNILPSINKLRIVDDLARVKARVLTIHGRRDRNAPYGGARQWAMTLPDARLITVPDAAHAPWIEAPDTVFGAIRTFMGNVWPESSKIVKVLDEESSAGG
ncbi:MAG TPA: alpha/beta hydrolase [Bryobacteraceae bacterium]|jgi:pimeloyl-ACP methyl ester carboxylesterase